MKVLARELYSTLSHAELLRRQRIAEAKAAKEADEARAAKKERRERREREGVPHEKKKRIKSDLGAEAHVAQLALSVAADLVHGVTEAYELHWVHVDLQVGTFSAVQQGNLVLSEHGLSLVYHGVNSYRIT